MHSETAAQPFGFIDSGGLNVNSEPQSRERPDSSGAEGATAPETLRQRDREARHAGKRRVMIARPPKEQATGRPKTSRPANLSGAMTAGAGPARPKLAAELAEDT